MPEVFEVADLLRVAVEDERTGIALYAALADRAASRPFKEFFRDLSDQERRHFQRFQKMLQDRGNYAPKEQYPGEYMAYLRTLTDTRAFPDEATALRLVQQCRGDGEALDLANRFERDTLILLNEMRGLVGPSDQQVVEEITREEQGHLVALADARRKLAS